MLMRRIPASQVSTPDINNTQALKLEDELKGGGGGGVTFRVNRLAEIFKELLSQHWKFCALAACESRQRILTQQLNAVEDKVDNKVDFFSLDIYFFNYYYYFFVLENWHKA